MSKGIYYILTIRERYAAKVDSCEIVCEESGCPRGLISGFIRSLSPIFVYQHASWFIETKGMCGQGHKQRDCGLSRPSFLRYSPLELR